MSHVEPKFIRVTFFEDDPVPMVEMWGQVTDDPYDIRPYLRIQERSFGTQQDYLDALEHSSSYVFTRAEQEL